MSSSLRCLILLQMRCRDVCLEWPETNFHVDYCLCCQFVLRLIVLGNLWGHSICRYFHDPVCEGLAGC